MSLTDILKRRMRLPIVTFPLFIVSTQGLVIAQCEAGVVGSLPALNARPKELRADELVKASAAYLEKRAPRFQD